MDDRVGDAAEAGLVEFDDWPVVGHHFALHLQAGTGTCAHLCTEKQEGM